MTSILPKRVLVMPKRISILGLVKFIAAVAIVYYHMVDLKTDHWGSLFLLVELFFFITGYFTYKHFIDRSSKSSINEKAKNAIDYTVQKIRPLLPYIVIAIILHGIAMAILALKGDMTRSGLLDAAIKSIMDVFLLGSQLNINNWALWFISAMVIALPIFCIACQYKQKYVHLIGFTLAAILFYFNTPNLDIINGPGAIIRAFIGLGVGAAIYIIDDLIISKKAIVKNYTKVMWSVVDIALFAGALLMMYPTRNSLNSRQCQSLAVLLMFLFMILLLSGRTLLSQISCKAMDFLEKISIVLFFIHQPIIQITALTYGPLDTVWLRVLMIVTCITISCILYVVVNGVQRLSSTRNNHVAK